MGANPVDPLLCAAARGMDSLEANARSLRCESDRVHASCQ